MKNQKGYLWEHLVLSFLLRNQQSEGTIWQSTPAHHNLRDLALLARTRPGFAATQHLKRQGPCRHFREPLPETQALLTRPRLLLKQHHSMVLTRLSLAGKSADAATGPAGCGMIGFWIRFRDPPHLNSAKSPRGTAAHSNPLNLQSTMRATLIWNDKRTPAILAGWAFKADRERDARSHVPRPNVSARHVREQRVITKALAADFPVLALFPTLLLVSRYETATSSRIRSSTAQTRRANVNVLTRLPKIRAVPAPVGPLNSATSLPTASGSILGTPLNRWLPGIWCWRGIQRH